ncbi:MAG: Fic family protein, partial [Bacteroidales bacterium]|nr:Fic family protein [Bacteroidales bacterium]
MGDQPTYGFEGFEEYILHGEPDKKQKAANWSIAIGLQAVDGLYTSEYLRQTAIKNIEGEITGEEVQKLIKTYYTSKTVRTADDNITEEADKVSANISSLLNEPTFAFTYAGLLAVHRRIFNGVFSFAGQIRTQNITKKEWVLDGETVRYVSALDLKEAIEYDLDEERKYNYNGLSSTETIKHLSKFVANLWQIHPFREGNTRTTAIFTVKYLQSMGFNVDNSVFAANSWYFRNALVRANFQNLQKGISYAPEYLEKFFRNLLLGEENDLKNRYLHIRWKTVNTPTS